MQVEIKALEDNNTWTLVSLPPAKVAIGCKWVYMVKHNVDGTVERYKKQDLQPKDSLSMKAWTTLKLSL
jgi:hypothetical protein